MYLCVCVLTQSCLTLCKPMDYSLSGSSVHGILQARILEWVAIPLLQGNLPDPGIKPGFPALQADSLPSESPGKPIGRVSCDHLVMMVSDRFLYQNVTGLLLQLMNFSWEGILRPCNILFLIMLCQLILSSTHDSCL